MKELKRIWQRLPFDIRAESLAAELIENNDVYLDINQLLITPTGPGGRRAGKEVKGISALHSPFVGGEVYYLEVARHSLADELPEAMVYDESVTSDDVAEKAAELDEQLAMARSFFRPFEQVMHFPRIELEFWERRASAQLPEAVFAHLRTQAFDELLSPSEQETLMALLPFMDQVVGQPRLTGQVLSALVDKPVDVAEVPPQTVDLPADASPGLGRLRLGVDSVLGQRLADGTKNFAIQVKEIKPEEVQAFLPGGTTRRAIEEVYLHYLLPLNIDYQIQILATEVGEGFTLAADADTSVLGYTTNLS